MSLRLPLLLGAPNDAFFDGMPQDVREFLAAGFSELARLPPESREGIASHASKWLDPREPEPEISALADGFGIGRNDMHAIISAVSLLASALSVRPSQTAFDTFLAQAKNARILTESNTDSIRAFHDALFGRHRLAVSFSLLRAHSSTNIVPSFQFLATAVDLRVASVEDDRPIITPVVMASLRTDVDGQEQIFQMTPRDVSGLVRQLQKLSENLSRLKNATTRLVPRE